VRFEQELEDYLSAAAAEETLDAVIDWGATRKSSRMTINPKC
jgi:hypothetical protein